MLEKDALVTKRELIQLALETLKPSGDAARLWAFKRAIVVLAKQARGDVKKDSLIKRRELREVLEGLADDVQGLMKKLNLLGVKEALNYAVIARDIDGREGLNDFESRRLERLSDARLNLADDLLTLYVSATAAVERLQLEGKRGDITPWSRFSSPAKVSFAAMGETIFCNARRLERRPDAKNKELAEFLRFAWEVGTGEQDVLNWTTALRSARPKIGPSRTTIANYATQLKAMDMEERIEQWEIAVVTDWRGVINAKILQPRPFAISWRMYISD